MDEQKQSILLIPIPEAESFIGSWREQYDYDSLHGIPSHVTLLFPFKHPDGISREVIEKLTSFFSSIKSFEYTLEEINNFPHVIFLVPTRKDLFIAITKGLVQIFPENLPYGGIYSEINPHVTIGQLTKIQDLAQIKDAIKKDIYLKLPIKARAEKALLMESKNGEWSIRETFTFI